MCALCTWSPGFIANVPEKLVVLIENHTPNFLSIKDKHLFKKQTEMTNDQKSSHQPKNLISNLNFIDKQVSLCRNQT